MFTRRARVPALCALAVAIGGVAATAFASTIASAASPHGSSSQTTVKINVGTSKPIIVHTKKPKIGYLWTSGNTFMAANLRGAKAEAKKLGLNMTVFDSSFDPQTQLTQIQDVLQQHKFNGLIVVPLDGNTMCPILTKQAPADNIPVVTMNIPMCNRTDAPDGPGLWSPGTVADVGFTATTTVNKAYFAAVSKQLGPGHHVVALELGPPLIAGSLATAAALKDIQAAHLFPNLDVKYVINTDFTAPTSLTDTQSLLQAHPDIDAIMTIYSDETVGVVQAVKEAGLQGKVNIFDQGGSRQVLDDIRAGSVTMSVGFFPYTYGADAVKALYDAFQGQKVPRWWGGYAEGSSLGHPYFIYKSNVDKFIPQAQ
jgi:ribose transport system substrate-binding protein